MKTTSPEKFRVKPSAGCLAPGEKTTVSVTLLQGFQLRGLSKDKFLLMSMPIDSTELSHQQLTDLWKVSLIFFYIGYRKLAISNFIECI